jgi:ribosomal protein S18 acetylase RimI-like enzyme
MTETMTGLRVRALDELDISSIVAIDEATSGTYRPDVWERRITYHLRRDPEASFVAEVDGDVVGFMLGEIRSGEFGLEEPTGWIEIVGVDPAHRGRRIGHALAEAVLEHFRRSGATTVRTLVDEKMAELGRFFGSLGFEPSTLRPFVKAL